MTTQEFNCHVVSISDNLKPHAVKMTKSIEDANDLIQETLLKAFKSRDKFKTGTNLNAWLYTIMRNLFINQYRRKKTQNTFIDHTENMHYLEDSQTDRNLGESNLAMEEVNNVINSLDEEYRNPLLMHQSGYKYKEISDILDVPMGTVKSRIFSARKKIRETLS